MIQEKIHKAIVKRKSEVAGWFKERSKDEVFPFYSSFDIRDSGFKVAPVDANIFPAGFNNICQTDKESAVAIAKTYIETHYDKVQNLVLLTEEHTNNPYYWENVQTLYQLLDQAGFRVRLAIPKEFDQPFEVESIQGHRLKVYSAQRSGSGIDVDGMTPDLVISNNDFSESYAEWAGGLQISMNPPREFGWHRRRKDRFFSAYNELAGDFARVIDIDPWLLQIQTDLYAEFDISREDSRKVLAAKVDDQLDSIRAKYAEHGIQEKPFVFVKNNSGTYGLAVIKAESGDEVLNWNYKSRKKMKAAKGGKDVEQVVIQEGIPSAVTSFGSTAEPAIYMIGCQLAGGFLRTHGKKAPDESLNSPGAVYKRLCVSDLNISIEGHPLENVYGWSARLGILAIAKEGKNANVNYLGAKQASNYCF